MGKNIKSYATTPIHSPGKGREASRQSPSLSKHIIWLNCTHLFLSLFQNQVLCSAKFPVNSADFT